MIYVFGEGIILINLRKSEDLFYGLKGIQDPITCPEMMSLATKNYIFCWSSKTAAEEFSA